MSESVQLLTRVDDAGLCEGVNEAVLEAANTGLVKNVSIMVPGPAFADAADRLKNRSDLCLGLHVTLNAEWEKVKWRPLSPPLDVASLVDKRGFFLPFPKDLHERKSLVSEMMTEIRLQLEAARKAGLNIQYLDEHMGVSWVCGLREQLSDFARQESLLDAHGISSFLQGGAKVDSTAHLWLDRLHAAFNRSPYVLISHVGYDRPDLQQCYIRGGNPGEVARDRDEERRAWQSIAWRQALTGPFFRIMRFDELTT